MRICAGVDAGSRSLKMVLLDAGTHAILRSGCVDQGVDQNALAIQLFHDLVRGQGLQRGDVQRIVATGYGRNLVSLADATITEITCHARGVRHLHPEARTVIEIGGQDSKVLLLNDAGGVRNFFMNDRCAAGTGRFLEMAAARMGLTLDGLDDLARRGRNPSRISSQCAVFAETEIIGLLASGVPPEDIVAGILASIATRVGVLAGRNVADPIVFTGGVALVPGMVQALQRVLNQPVFAATAPLLTGALGAAILAGERG
ncbi:MAG: acyl-CoA dehydratase activase [bacterium]